MVLFKFIHCNKREAENTDKYMVYVLYRRISLDKLPGFHKNSFDLGMIEAFCEIVSQEVKNLALSPILTKKEYAEIKEAAAEIAEKFHVLSFPEDNFISTDLAADEEIKDKIVILYFKEEKVLEDYFILKNKIESLKKAGAYNKEAIKEASVEFRKMLSYSPKVIAETYGESI